MLINEIMIWRMSHEYQMHFITLLAIKSKHSFYDIKVYKEQQGQGAQGGGLIIMQKQVSHVMSLCFIFKLVLLE